MYMICGVDGCRRGWVAVFMELESGQVTWRNFETAQALFNCDQNPQVIAIDIPIGLPDRGLRQCDQAARLMLGSGRASSVFPAPNSPCSRG